MRAGHVLVVVSEEVTRAAVTRRATMQGHVHVVEHKEKHAASCAQELQPAEQWVAEGRHERQHDCRALKFNVQSFILPSHASEDTFVVRLHP